MMSFLAEATLSLALVVTCASVFILHRRLKRLGDDLVVYRRALAESSVALDAGRDALRLLINEGHDLAVALAERLEKAGVAGNRDDSRDTVAASEAPATKPALSIAASLHRFRSVAVGAGPAHTTEAA